MKLLLRCIAAFLLFAGWSAAVPAPVLAPVPAMAVVAPVPPEAFRVLAYVREHHEAPPGHAGGRRFGNFEGHLPKADARGRRIAYQEWDVFPKVPGRSRGAHRLVTGNDGRAWYTDDHYRSFTELKGRR